MNVQAVAFLKPGGPKPGNKLADDFSSLIARYAFRGIQSIDVDLKDG